MITVIPTPSPSVIIHVSQPFCPSSLACLRCSGEQPSLGKVYGVNPFYYSHTAEPFCFGASQTQQVFSMRVQNSIYLGFFLQDLARPIHQFLFIDPGIGVPHITIHPAVNITVSTSEHGSTCNITLPFDLTSI